MERMRIADDQNDVNGKVVARRSKAVAMPYTTTTVHGQLLVEMTIGA